MFLSPQIYYANSHKIEQFVFYILSMFILFIAGNTDIGLETGTSAPSFDENMFDQIYHIQAIFLQKQRNPKVDIGKLSWLA